MIYELAEIALKTDEIFAPFGEEAAEFVLRRRADTQAKSRCETAAKQLCVSFPPSFAKVACEFDLDNFSLKHAYFGGSGDYFAWLVQINSPDIYGGKWWQGERRPPHLIAVANGDPYSYLLDCQSGAVFAELSDEICTRRVAGDFERFFRALASVNIALNSGVKDENLLGEILDFTGRADALAREFWKEIISV